VIVVTGSTGGPHPPQTHRVVRLSRTPYIETRRCGAVVVTGLAEGRGGGETSRLTLIFVDMCQNCGPARPDGSAMQLRKDGGGFYPPPPPPPHKLGAPKKKNCRSSSSGWHGRCTDICTSAAEGTGVQRVVGSRLHVTKVGRLD